MSGCSLGKSYRIVALVLAVLTLARTCHGLEFEMQTQTKCIYEEVNANVMVVGEYQGVHKEHPEHPIPLDVQVQDASGKVLQESKGQSKGQFAFTSKNSGEYRACFTVADPQATYYTKLKLEWKTGVAASDWDSIAKKEHLDALSVEMRKLEGSIREIYGEMLQLQQREQQMRDLNETTNARVAWFSVAALLICIASGLWQLWYLKKFFTRKKLI